MALGLLNVHFWTSACHQDDILRNRLGNLLETIEDKYYLISLLFDSKILRNFDNNFHNNYKGMLDILDVLNLKKSYLWLHLLLCHVQQKTARI